MLSRLLSATLALVLATTAQADIRLISRFTPAMQPGTTEQVLLIDAGADNAGRLFLAIPFAEGRAQRALARRYDSLRGTLNENGRALLTLTLPSEDRLSLEEQSALRAGVTHRVAVLDANFTVLEREAGGNFALSTTQNFTVPAVSPLISGPVRAETGVMIPARQDLSTVQVTVPTNGATVGSPAIDVEGRIGGVLNRAGTLVTVNGQAAEVFASATGAGTFLLPNLELTSGQNTITVLAVPPSGPPVQSTSSVSFVPTTSNNVVVANGRAYAARGTQGLAVMDLRTREVQSFTNLLQRVDDLDVADGLLFLLDAQSGGRLAVASLTDSPTLLSGPVTVPVGPFAGVAAAGGRVVVSGGTSLLTVRSYSANGTLGTSVASIDLGIGQPDVLLSEDGSRAFVSTDFAGSVGGAGFGISTIALNTPPAAPNLLSRTGLPGSGFTSGAQGPANFPIESALVNGALVTAHGGGLSRISETGAFLGTTPLGFAATSVAALGEEIFVVGSGRRLSILSLAGNSSPTLIST
ncbi:MAG: hypothetical protein AAF368_01340, partial [Planctomycetota bacterium]